MPPRVQKRRRGQKEPVAAVSLKEDQDHSDVDEEEEQEEKRTSSTSMSPVASYHACIDVNIVSIAFMVYLLYYWTISHCNSANI